jgi:Coenzyme PQQ synthesis protein D (PqqD)
LMDATELWYSSAVDSSACPRVTEGIAINEVPDGYVIYDPKRDRVHYLNQTAVLILELCNGQVAASDLPALVQNAFDLPEPPAEEVEKCLQTLFDEGLVG